MAKLCECFPSFYLLLQDVIITLGNPNLSNLPVTFVSLASGRQYYPVLGMLGSAQCRSTNQDKSALVCPCIVEYGDSRCSNVRNANMLTSRSRLAEVDRALTWEFPPPKTSGFS